MTPRVSRCIFCGSASYGAGCRYGPKGHHFHPDDPKKCSWCGSASYGPGCRLNPNGKAHVHGIDYNPMLNEAVKYKLLMNELNRPIVEFVAYKLGIINRNGDKIKEPVTEQELNAYTPTVKTILKIKKYLGPKLDLINNTAILENTSKAGYNKDNHLKLLKLEEQVNDILESLHKTVDNALNEGLSLEQVQAILYK